MDKTNFILYKDYQSHVELLSDEQAGKLFKAIFKYVGGRQEVELDGMTTMAFSFIKASLERDLVKYKKRVLISQDNGKLGGRPKNDDLKTVSGKKVPIEKKGKHFIYLIYDFVNDEYKIGETKCLIKRRYSIKRPTKNLNIIDFVVMNDIECKRLEKEIIKDYSYCRISGDWFELDKEEANDIISRLKENLVGYKKTQSVINLPRKVDSVSDSVSDNDLKRIPYADILKTWNDTEELSSIRILHDKRKKLIKKVYKLDDGKTFKEIVTRAINSNFMVENKLTNIDWMMNENNYAKILEGKYDNKE